MQAKKKRLAVAIDSGFRGTQMDRVKYTRELLETPRLITVHPECNKR